MKRIPFVLTVFFAATVGITVGAGVAHATPAPGAVTPVNDLPTVRDIRLLGEVPIPLETILGALPIHIGEPLSQTDIRLAREIAASTLRNRGYLDAAVHADAEREGDETVLLLTITPGPLTRFGDTYIEGLETLPQKVILMELTYKPGEPFDRRALFRTQSRLFLTGLFDDLRIQTTTTTTHTADVHIQVQERRLKRIKGGVGWGSEEKERVTLTLANDNMFRRAHRAEATATFSRIWLEYRLDYVNPYFWGTRTDQRTSASWRKENREGYDLERTLVRAGLGRALTRQIKGDLAFELKQTNTYNVDEDIAAVTPKSADSRMLALAFHRDATDDFFFPRKGTRALLALERAGGVLGGNVDFNRVRAEARAYQRVWKGLIAAGVARGGVVRPFSPSTEVPIFERFFLGGANSIRGYAERRAGPVDSQGSPFGGTRMASSSVELRFPVFRRLMGAVFLDGGAVGFGATDLDPSEWLFSSGAGLRYQTPVGPIRVDWGYKITPEPNDPDRWRVHLSLGESF